MLMSNNNSGITRMSFLLFLLLVVASSTAAQTPTPTPPLVYDVENTGADCPPPTLLPYDQLPFTRPLTDPFLWSDGSGRSTAFSDWRCRRNEIKKAIEKWDIGPKPDRSDLTITAVYTPGDPGTLTVDVLRLSNGRTLRLTSPINLPSGTAPAGGWPALIRMALAPTGAEGPSGIAGIDYVHNDVTEYAAGQQISHAADPYFLMYPEYNAGPCPPAPAPCGATQVGQYAAWSWGVSRLIDGMEIAKNQLVNPLPIDLKRLAVNGCSYAGKMALFAGAFDERIALTWATESGGGGAPAWRTSHAIEPNGAVEKASNTDGSWFITRTLFASNNVYKFPYDHHELMAMVAPRALLVSGNTDFIWLSNRSNYVTSRATQKVYDTFGIGERFGFYIDGGHGHCAIPAAQQPAINAFYNKFLRGQNVSTDVHVFPTQFADIDYQRWTQWWGTGVPDDPRLNVALASAGAIAFGTTEHSSGGYPASAAIDGDGTGNFWERGGGWNDNTRGTFPDILEINFNGLHVIDEIVVYTLQNNWLTAGEPDQTSEATGEGILDFDVQTNTTTCSAGGPCTTGTAWVTVPGGSVTGNTMAVRRFTFPSTIAATKMRVVVNNARNHYSRIVEVKALGFKAGFPTVP